MSDSKSTVKFSILSALSSHGGKIIDARIGEEIVQDIYDSLFSSHLFWALKKEVENHKPVKEKK